MDDKALCKIWTIRLGCSQIRIEVLRLDIVLKVESSQYLALHKSAQEHLCGMNVKARQRIHPRFTSTNQFDENNL
jgi:hypothetical protein